MAKNVKMDLDNIRKTRDAFIWVLVFIGEFTIFSII